MQKMVGRKVGMSDSGTRRLYIKHFQSGVECHTVSGSFQHFQGGMSALAVR